MSGEASLRLGEPVPGRASRLTIGGANWGPAPTRLQVNVGDRVVADAIIPPGDYRLGTPIDPPLEGGPWTLGLHASPTFVPAERGLADRRTLGLFVSEICFE